MGSFTYDVCSNLGGFPNADGGAKKFDQKPKFETEVN